MRFKFRAMTIALGLASATLPAQADDLYQIYQQALTKDPVLLQAKATRDAAFEAIDQSRASLLPQISGSLGYGVNWFDDLGEQTDDGGSGSAGLSLNQSIYDHANYVNLALSEKSASQSDANYALAVQNLVVRVSQAYFDVLSAQDALEFVQANKRAIERQLEQTKQRFAVGLTAITDVHEAQAQYDLAVAEEINAQNTLENSYEGLREITGIPHTDLAVLDTQRFSPSTPTPSTHEAWLALGEESSLELLSRRLGVDIAKERINLAKTGHLPSLGLSAGVTKSFSEDDRVGSISNDTTGNVALQLSVPIFQGFSVSSQVEQAKYNFVASSQALEESHRSVVRSLRNSLNNVNASMSTIRAYEQSVVSAESALKATEAGFEVGTRTIVEVLTSTRQLYSAKQQLADARYNYILAVLSLKQAAGTLSEEDVQMINKGLK
ncbi:outer membrane channel protein TolC [Ferrimonas sp. SCSIO 43195]|uniref:outer membrane channel protein TolC n=1 Tax=Ferrimonas sp. SCSIO 43195 TaxID=2822844 RepID=UPI00207600F7|nr:outer membrane channel protein TolC [Ferrimonas sp. SCSIO 43195]USD37057.1 outer membrane channel protein TolC [Ferrimonas sp. SCSIO 43195]